MLYPFTLSTSFAFTSKILGNLSSDVSFSHLHTLFFPFLCHSDIREQNDISAFEYVKILLVEASVFTSRCKPDILRYIE